MVLILVSPSVFGGVGVAHLGFTTSVWWGPCCSSWFHHQCLVGSVLLILVSPPVFGGVRVAHLGFTTSFWWGPCCSSWFHHQFLVGSVLLILVVLPVLFFFVLCLVCLVLPVPVDCPFLSSRSIFPNVLFLVNVSIKNN